MVSHSHGIIAPGEQISDKKASALSFHSLSLSFARSPSNSRSVFLSAVGRFLSSHSFFTLCSLSLLAHANHAVISASSAASAVPQTTPYFSLDSLCSLRLSHLALFSPSPPTDESRLRLEISLFGLAIFAVASTSSLDVSDAAAKADADNVLEERDPRYDVMLSQMVGQIQSKPGGKLEMGEAFVVEKYIRPMPKLRNTKSDSGRYEERLVRGNSHCSTVRPNHPLASRES